MESVSVTTVTYDANTVSFGASSFEYADSVWFIDVINNIHNTKYMAINVAIIIVKIYNAFLYINEI